ncbi:MAG: hypothetical protein AB1715_11515 [Acidobacteriota bacterium]
MSRLKRRFAAAVPALMLLASGCLSIQVASNVDDPDRYFRRAYSQIESLHKEYPGREGAVHSLQLLVYDGSDRKVVRIGVPMWLVNACLKAGTEAAEHDSDDLDFEKQYEIAWRSVRDLDKIGPGLLVEVVDEQDRVLVWLR